VDGVLLHVHVEHQRCLRHPLVLVSEAQRREALWCTGREARMMAGRLWWC
jgi:hypothetical protein